MTPTTDILGRPEIVRLVDRFYEKVRADDMLGPIFTDIAEVDWDTHLPKLYAFWQTVLFGDGGFRGNPMGAHFKLAMQTSMDWSRFERWLQLFHETVDELFLGENATHIKRVADDMAKTIHTRLQPPA